MSEIYGTIRMGGSCKRCGVVQAMHRGRSCEEAKKEYNERIRKTSSKILEPSESLSDERLAEMIHRTQHHKDCNFHDLRNALRELQFLRKEMIEQKNKLTKIWEVFELLCDTMNKDPVEKAFWKDVDDVTPPDLSSSKEKSNPICYIYEWDVGGNKHYQLDSSPYNGRECDRSFPVYGEPIEENSITRKYKEKTITSPGGYWRCDCRHPNTKVWYADEIDELREEMAKLQKDAERYRYLRDFDRKIDEFAPVCVEYAGRRCPMMREDLDKLVDKYIEKEGK